METRTCKSCGSSFEPRAPQQIYCRAECRLEANFPKKTRLCQTCGEPTGHGNRKWCSESCKPQKAPKPLKEPYSRVCESCEATWFPANRSVKATTCPECREQEREGHVYVATKGWRKAVRKRAKNLCEECGATEQDTGAYHHAHHVKPRAEGGLNTLANGKLLCVNCHDEAHGGNAVGGAPLRHGSGGLSDKDVERIAKAVVALLREQTVQVPMVNSWQ